MKPETLMLALVGAGLVYVVMRDRPAPQQAYSPAPPAQSGDIFSSIANAVSGIVGALTHPPKSGTQTL